MVGLLIVPVLAAVLTLLGTAIVNSRQRRRERRSDSVRVLIRSMIDSGEDAYREDHRSLSGPATFALIKAGLEFTVEMRGKSGEVSLWVVDQITQLQDDSAFADPQEFATRTRMISGKLADWAAGACPTRRFREELSPRWRAEFENRRHQGRSNYWWRRAGRLLGRLIILKPVAWHRTWTELPTD